MFSETGLGALLRQVYAGGYPELLDHRSAIALATLLMADESISGDIAQHPELLRALSHIYGDQRTWRNSERQLSSRIIEALRHTRNELEAAASDTVIASLSGLIGDTSPLPTKAAYRTTAQHIEHRLLRIFHGRHEQPRWTGSNLFVCVVGHKASGKSIALRYLHEQGIDCLEIYRELDIIRETDSAAYGTLPPRGQWQDQPLRLGLQKRGVFDSSGKIYCIGSLLRQSEIDLLSTLGRVVSIYIQCPNAIRHKQAKQRGRTIEISPDPNRLIELDAHRDGLWPGYEGNDLGAIIAGAHHTVSNEDITLEQLHAAVYSIVKGEGVL